MALEHGGLWRCDNRAIRVMELSELNIEDAGEGSERIWRELLSLVSQPIIERPGMPGKAVGGIDMMKVDILRYI